MGLKPILEAASITSTFHKTSESTSVASSTIQREMQSIKKRHVLAIYAFLGFFIAYALRANLSVAIVDMARAESAQDIHPTTATTTASTTSTSNSQPAVTERSGDDEFNLTTATSTPPSTMTTVHYGDKKWSPILQGYILSSFFFGYIVTQLVSCNQIQQASSTPGRSHLSALFLIAGRLLDHQIWWTLIFRSGHRLLRLAESVHAVGHVHRAELCHRPPCGPGPCPRLRISGHALPVVQVGASIRAQSSRHVRLVRLLHRLGIRAQRRRRDWQDIQLASHLLRLW